MAASVHSQPTDFIKDHVKVGMLAFLLSEVAFFGTLIMTYVIFLRQTMESKPSPAEVFYLPMVIAGTACLLASSLTIHLAEGALRCGARGRFIALWGLTILLGLCFLAGTALEWADLIGKYKLTISRNMFGTTYFTLVGFHAGHVTMGLIVLSTMFGLVLARHISGPHSSALTAVSWYWHFVDAVWVVVFTLVYLVGR